MFVIFIIIVVILYLHIQNYKKSSYQKSTKNSILDVYFDKGKYGEYLTYQELKLFEKEGNKFLFNLYIPTLDSKTAELDLVMITKKGIFVFESKNYSGWIFGEKNSRMWMQTLPNGRGKAIKNNFFNPIIQNEWHIEKLKKVLDNVYEDMVVPFFSIITFSERCTLKKVPENMDYIKIIKRNNLFQVVKNIYDANPDIIEQEKVIDLYNKLYQYTQVTEKIKQEHIDNIKNNH